MCRPDCIFAETAAPADNRFFIWENDMKPVRKAVFPVAGLGTRFLPATKAMPKEMLPVVDKPLIQYAVEEAAAAGITDMTVSYTHLTLTTIGFV